MNSALHQAHQQIVARSSVIGINNVHMHTARATDLGLRMRNQKAKKNGSEPTLILHIRLPETAMENGGLMSIGLNLPWASAKDPG